MDDVNTLIKFYSLTSHALLCIIFLQQNYQYWPGILNGQGQTSDRWGVGERGGHRKQRGKGWTRERVRGGWTGAGVWEGVDIGWARAWLDKGTGEGWVDRGRGVGRGRDELRGAGRGVEIRHVMPHALASRHVLWLTTLRSVVPIDPEAWPWRDWSWPVNTTVSWLVRGHSTDCEIDIWVISRRGSTSLTTGWPDGRCLSPPRRCSPI